MYFERMLIGFSAHEEPLTVSICLPAVGESCYCLIIVLRPVFGFAHKFRLTTDFNRVLCNDNLGDVIFLKQIPRAMRISLYLTVRFDVRADGTGVCFVSDALIQTSWPNIDMERHDVIRWLTRVTAGRHGTKIQVSRHLRRDLFICKPLQANEMYTRYFTSGWTIN